MAKGLDIGTMFIVKAEHDSDGQLEFSIQRNCFLQAATSDDTEDILREQKWSFAKVNDDFYILGEDAIKLKNLLTMGDDSIVVTKVGELRRPMKDGMLNVGEERLSTEIIKEIIRHLVGTPESPGEHLCYCVPGEPVDRNMSVLLHQKMLTSFLKSLGYTVEFIPEAFAIINSEQPVSIYEGEESEMTGIAFSFGAGMANVCMALKKMPAINFSVARSGDWIDEQVAAQLKDSKARITKFKETKLDLSDVDFSDMRQYTLAVYYQAMIEHAVKNFANKFNQLDKDKDKAEAGEFEIVVAGGTAMVPGFLDIFKEVLSTMELPFKVKNVRLADEPLYSVASGCLAKALSTEKKAAKVQATAVAEEAQEVLKELEKQEPVTPSSKVRVPRRG